MRAKLATIVETGAQPRTTNAKPVRTSFTEREINAYFAVDGPAFLPRGITTPRFSIAPLGKGERARVTARAIVDLDVVRHAQPRDLLDPFNYLSGRLEVTAAGSVGAANGVATLQLESATMAGVSLPESVLKEVVRYFTTTPDTPNGIDIGKPFELPARIRAVTFEPGRATVVQ